MNNPVFVLGCGSNGYGVIRSLSMYDPRLEIVGIDCDSNAPGLYSKHLTAARVLERPSDDGKKWVDDLIALAATYKVRPVVIFTTDLFLSVINLHRQKAEEHLIFNTPSQSLLEQIMNKKTQYAMIAALGIKLPRTKYLPDGGGGDVRRDIQYPVFVKGAFPHLWKRHFVEKGFVVKNAGEMESRLAELATFKLDLVIQELIVGPNKNHYKVSAYYDKKGNPKAFFTTQKARQFPPDFGVGSYMVSKRMEELIEMGKKIFGALHYTGVGSIEFKKDERDGAFKFIELNPRMWQQNYQAAVAGLNFAEMYYRDCTGERIEYNEAFRENISFIDTVNDFQSFLVNKKNTGESFFEWAKQVIRADCYSFFESKDINPILRSSRYGANLFRYPRSFFRKTFTT